MIAKRKIPVLVALCAMGALAVVAAGCGGGQRTGKKEAQRQEALHKRAELVAKVVSAPDVQQRIEAAAELADMGDLTTAVELAGHYPQIQDPSVRAAVKEAIRAIEKRTKQQVPPEFGRALEADQ